MEKIKVLVIDDSAFMRKLITDFLTEDSRIHVIGTARNGEEGIKKIKLLNPDVVTLDVEMPILDGIQALERIMKEHPVPVIMLSSTTQQGADNTIRAMQMGAIDFIPKPSGAISLDLFKVKEALKEKVLLASKVKQSSLFDLTNKLEKTANLRTPNSNSKMEPLKESKYSKRVDENGLHTKTKQLVVVGTSTGGPRALQQVLTKLPKELDSAILIVQHMPAGFTRSLANRLNSMCHITVKEAEQGERINKGVAYIAPGGYHLTVNKIGEDLTVHLLETELVNGHRPSVDVLFESVSKLEDYFVVAVIMTGMGSDGTNGIIELAKNGMVKIIAESQETCIVFGMPKTAIATKYVDEIKRVEDISDAIKKYIERQGV